MIAKMTKEGLDLGFCINSFTSFFHLFTEEIGPLVGNLTLWQSAGIHLCHHSIQKK